MRHFIMICTYIKRPNELICQKNMNFRKKMSCPELFLHPPALVAWDQSAVRCPKKKKIWVFRHFKNVLLLCLGGRGGRGGNFVHDR